MLAAFVAGLFTACAAPEPSAESARSRAEADLRALQQEFSARRERQGRWPSNAEGVAMLAARSPDPWGRHYQYRTGAAGKGPKLWSLGPDPVATADDVLLDRAGR